MFFWSNKNKNIFIELLFYKLPGSSFEKVSFNSRPKLRAQAKNYPSMLSADIFKGNFICCKNIRAFYNSSNTDWACWFSQSLTVKRFLPFFLLLAKTAWPAFEDMRFLKPCVFFRFLLLSLVVVFILLNLYSFHII